MPALSSDASGMSPDCLFSAARGSTRVRSSTGFWISRCQGLQQMEPPFPGGENAALLSCIPSSMAWVECWLHPMSAYITQNSAPQYVHRAASFYLTCLSLILYVHFLCVCLSYVHLGKRMKPWRCQGYFLHHADWSFSANHCSQISTHTLVVFKICWPDLQSAGVLCNSSVQDSSLLRLSSLISMSVTLNSKTDVSQQTNQ